MRHTPRGYICWLLLKGGNSVGDSRRALVFADWVLRQFPRAKRVADIAGGSGELATWLTRCGYEVTTFDLRPTRKLPCRAVRCDVSDLHFKPGQFDLVVGMHPDGATWHVIRLASEAGVPFAVVPCCAIPPPGMKWYGRWPQWLATQAGQFGFETWTTELHMGGEHTVIKGWPSKQGGKVA